MTNTQLPQPQSILLDLLRYFLAAVVVVGHGFGFFLGHLDGFFPRVFPHLQSIAVACFFYLSGYLIAGSQIRRSERGEGGLGQYVFDRATRIYVTLIPSLLFVAMVDLAFLKFSTVNIDLARHYTSLEIFLNNLFLIPSMPFGTLRPIWSLMYEWWIYLLFGGFYFLRSNKLRAALLLVAGTYYTLKVNANGETGHIWILWALGGVCAWLQPRISWKNTNPWALSALSFVFLMIAGWRYYITKNAYNLPAGIFLALSIYIVTNLAGRFPELLLPLGRAARNLAGFSFTLFLTHYTVLIYTKAWLKVDGWVGLVVGFLISTLIAFAIAFFTEFRLATIKNFLAKAGQFVPVWR